MAAGERFVNIKPTMGPGTDSLRFALNVTPQMGALQRRPAIRALELGYGITKNAATDPDVGEPHYPTDDGGPTVGEPNLFYDAVGQVYSTISFENVPYTIANPTATGVTASHQYLKDPEKPLWKKGEKLYF